MIKNVTFGSDPEYFIINKDSGNIISSIPLINGNKEVPESLGDGYFILKDNVLVEGNIPICKSRSEFLFAMLELKKRILRYLQDQYVSLDIVHSDCEDLEMHFLSSAEALEFGCSPYLNAWDNLSHRANDLSSESFRTAGTHIHYGYEIEDGVHWGRENINMVIARAFDMFVTIPSYFINFDERRFYNYGGLGQYRDTPYGLECRSLGGYFSKDEILPWVFDQGLKALDFIKNEENFGKLYFMNAPTIFNPSKESIGIDEEYYNYLGISLDEQLLFTKRKVII